jgi:hypothetical protein
MQMYIIALKGEYSEDTSREIQRHVRAHGGLIMMATRAGPIVALEDSDAKVVATHPLVAHMGPVTLNPRGFAADRLARVFAENLSRQIDIRAMAEDDIHAMPEDEAAEFANEPQLTRFHQGGRPWP